MLWAEETAAKLAVWCYLNNTLNDMKLAGNLIWFEKVIAEWI